MLSENEVTKRAITWHILALNAEVHSPNSAPAVHSKANAYIAVLDLPHSLQCGKRSVDGLRKYAKERFDAMSESRGDDEHFNVNAWIKKNTTIDFESHI
ncbi:MAG: hypothetical protein CL840_14950 [Crocinitomicaceae bacterium]|nr:hypothetical protein [Crocinitomicaceae bacterium]|tara:strand:+ start:3362 stop:3658 length:297 start_codon:yes stop_codon:yes gene_type:complete